MLKEPVLRTRGPRQHPRYGRPRLVLDIFGAGRVARSVRAGARGVSPRGPLAGIPVPVCAEPRGCRFRCSSAQLSGSRRRRSGVRLSLRCPGWMLSERSCRPGRCFGAEARQFPLRKITSGYVLPRFVKLSLLSIILVQHLRNPQFVEMLNHQGEPRGLVPRGFPLFRALRCLLVAQGSFVVRSRTVARPDWG